MGTLVLIIIVLIVGFVCGFLVCRKDIKTLEEVKETLKNKISALEDELKKSK